VGKQLTAVTHRLWRSADTVDSSEVSLKRINERVREQQQPPLLLFAEQ
jgi:hypothetical protein